MKRKIISHASDGNATSRGAKKARHNYTEANAQTAKIFENLSSNDPGARLEAAQKLSQKYSRNAILKSDLSHVEPDKEADKDQAVNFDDLKQILSRLMRGLCSSRNSARHGFYVALTELCRTHADSQELRPKILKLLTRSTTIDQGTSTQVYKANVISFGALLNLILGRARLRSRSIDRLKRYPPLRAIPSSQRRGHRFPGAHRRDHL